LNLDSKDRQKPGMRGKDKGIIKGIFSTLRLFWMSVWVEEICLGEVLKGAEHIVGNDKTLTKEGHEEHE
jgi:hypothetical protein